MNGWERGQLAVSSGSRRRRARLRCARRLPVIHSPPQPVRPRPPWRLMTPLMLNVGVLLLLRQHQQQHQQQQQQQHHHHQHQQHHQQHHTSTVRWSSNR